MSQLCLIVAMTPERVIGINNTLPWHLPRDLQHFKNTTMGCPVIMGRKTWDSIGRPLPGRLNVVVTRQAGLVLDGATVVHSLDDAIQTVAGQPRVFVIGGANIYEQALPLADELYLTEVETKVDGDAWFPQTEPAHWEEVENVFAPADEKNLLNCRFRTLRRIR